MSGKSERGEDWRVVDRGSPSWRLIPDLDDELVRALRQAGQVLRTVAEWQHRDAQDFQDARAALERLSAVIGPTQAHGGRSAIMGGRLLSSDQRRFYRPLRLVWPSPNDLEILSEAAATMGLVLAAHPDSELSKALTAGADAAHDCRGPAPTPIDIVAALTAVLGLLTLAPTTDSRQLAALIWQAGSQDCVLPLDAEAAYRRAITRLTSMWDSAGRMSRSTH